ncbi:MAG: HPr family phosphocarrier protein [Lachnospiraceae bacterium]|nr:HPr family phosphocarrier protein [Lachnospiraceae bacterium]
MITKELVIDVKGSLDARPTAMLVQIACKYSSSIYIESGNRKVNAKSIMGMMTLSLVSGDHITVEVNGADAEAALEEITAYLCNN